MNLQFKITDQLIKRVDDFDVVANSQNYLYANFEFTEEWKSLYKTAIFKYNDQAYEVIIIDDACEVPNEVIKAPSFVVSIYAGDLITTNSAKVYVTKSGLINGKPWQPTENMYNQIMELKQDKLTAGENISIVDNIISSSATGVKFEVVENLPEIGQVGIIYLLLIKNSKNSDNIYEEYIWLELGKYELIGTTNVDLTNYYTKTEIDDLNKNNVYYKILNINNKTIELNNQDTISSKSIQGQSNNILEISDLNNVEIGSKNLHSNINSVDEITINETKTIATFDQIEATESKLNKKIDDIISNSVTLDGSETLTNKTIDAENNLISNLQVNNFKWNVITSNVSESSPSETKIPNEKAVSQSITQIKGELASFITKEGVETISNKIINADSNQITNLKVNNFSLDSVATSISNNPSDIKFPTEQAVKQRFDSERLQAGENVTINNNIISAVPATYTAGTNIEINGNVISAQGLNYQAGSNISINGKVISAINIPEYLNNFKDINLTELKNGQLLGYNSSTSKWENMTNSGGTQYTATGYVHISDENVITVDLSSKQDKLYAGTNIVINGNSISANLKVSSLDDINISNLAGGQILVYNDANKEWVNSTPSGGTQYTGGENVTISDGNVISVDLSTKQDKLVAGDNITISGNRISANTDLTAEKIPYYNGSITNVAQALDSLLYVKPVISSFSGGGTYEIGTIVNEVNLVWALNKVINSQSLRRGNTVIASPEISARSYTDSDLNLTEDTVYQLTVSDGQNSVNSSTSILFRLRRYWGTSVKEILSDDEIFALSNELSQSRTQTRNFDCSGGKYFYFVISQKYCQGIKFVVGGLSVSDFNIESRTLINKLGHSEIYNIYRSTNLQYGNPIIVEVS